MSDVDSSMQKFIAANVSALFALTASREMFGKSYFSLGAGEKQALDQATISMIGANYQALTPQFLGAMPKSSAGFQSAQTSQNEPKKGS